MTPEAQDGSEDRHDRDYDAEFSRMLGDEGLATPSGRAPREPPAPGGDRRERNPDARDHDACADRGDPHHLDDEEPRIPPELEDDEVLLGDFEPPDPDLPTPADSTVWSWAALIGGLVLVLLGSTTAIVPTWAGPIGAAIGIGGLVSLLWKVPRGPSDDGNGAEV